MQLNKVYTENCLFTMAKMPDNFIDLTITSPPYDDLRNYNGYSFDFESIAKELFRATKQGGILVWVVGDAVVNGSETGTSFKQALFFKEIGFNLHDTMIYKKQSPAYPANDKSNRYGQVFEYMFVLTKGNPKTFNLLKDKKNKWAGHRNFGTPSERLKNGEIKERSKQKTTQNFGYRFNIWEYASGYGNSTKDEIAYSHPAIFPEQLAGDHIISWSNPGDVVYDCFGGSGTVAKMCHLLHRNWIISEISEKYVNEITLPRLLPYLNQTLLL